MATIVDWLMVKYDSWQICKSMMLHYFLLPNYDAMTIHGMPSFDRGCHLWPKCLAGCLPAAWISTTETAAAGSVLAQTSHIHPHTIHTLTNCNDPSTKRKINRQPKWTVRLMGNLWFSKFWQECFAALQHDFVSGASCKLREEGACQTCQMSV